MTPKAKAEELINSMYPQTDVPKYSNAIKCAIIAVEEIVKALTEYGEDSDELQNMDSELRWWDDVLTELKNMQ